ncbi:MAG: phenylalanine--tRNA ligase subunit beta [Candidatus Andersenbacteria bacterium]|nr:phenylalanine--tRNA ligase subunit beta [Candidatus Andersenbacteria bacterium]
MQISYNWLKEFLPTLTASPEEVAEQLTLHSVEATVANRIEVDPTITVVKIVKLDVHPNADRLRLATVTDGEKEITVVCGAPNIEVGQVVPYSPPGTTVHDEEGGSFKIKEAKIRGVKSPGMLNSLRELGLHREHAGIWVLPPDVPLGSKLADHIPPDTILNLDVTPNRAHDLLSHRGVAREVAALLQIEMKEIAVPPLPMATSEVEGYTVAVADAEDTPRYIGALLQGVGGRPAPLWMQMRLLASGTRPINLIVDVTNYVMYEVGNPSHAFDRAKLASSAIGVRRGKENEKITLLDETVVEVSPEISVITVGDKAVAVAGVMGGMGTEIGDTTTDIFLEVANFRPYLIQETSRRLNTRTEASTRFSKGITPTLASEAAARLVQLLIELGGATLQGVIDTHPEAFASKVIEFRPRRVVSLAGTSIGDADMRKVLERLRFAVAVQGDVWQVNVPSDRLDVVIEPDVVEEVIRITGLGAIESKPLESLTPVALPKLVYWREAIRDLLVEQGFTETYNYSFEPEVEAALLDHDQEEKVEVLNPVSPDQKYMRARLLPGLLKNLLTNKDDFHRKFSKQERALFEIGSVFRKGKNGRVPEVVEREHIAGCIVGGTPDVQQVVAAIANALGTELPTNSFVGPLPAAVLKGLKYRLPVTAFEFDIADMISRAQDVSVPIQKLSELENANIPVVQFTQYSQHPSMYRDISLVVHTKASAQEVEGTLKEAGGELLKDVELFDEFELSKKDQKSLAFHIEFQALDRTLTDDEIDKVQGKITTALKKKYQAEIR